MGVYIEKLSQDFSIEGIRGLTLFQHSLVATGAKPNHLVWTSSWLPGFPAHVETRAITCPPLSCYGSMCQGHLTSAHFAATYYSARVIVGSSMIDVSFPFMSHDTKSRSLHFHIREPRSGHSLSSTTQPRTLVPLRPTPGLILCRAGKPSITEGFCMCVLCIIQYYTI